MNLPINFIYNRDSFSYDLEGNYLESKRWQRGAIIEKLGLMPTREDYLVLMILLKQKYPKLIKRIERYTNNYYENQVKIIAVDFTYNLAFMTSECMIGDLFDVVPPPSYSSPPGDVK